MDSMIFAARTLLNWDGYPEEEFSLILGLSGKSVWGEYDFCMFHGILYMPERPYRVSNDEIPFTWRDQERGEGEMSFDPDKKGFIRFLGDGCIEGQINVYGDAKFIGWRVSGDETPPPRRAASMKEEWEGYNEREYGCEARARWGRW